MPSIGQHETAQRLFLSGVGGLYALTADAKKVIKVLQPPEGIWSEDTIREEIDGFLLRAKTQRAIAKTSKNWAPVYETGAIREGTGNSSGGGEAMGESTAAEGSYRAAGAYCLMDRYERSIQSLIDGRVNLNNDDLRNVMSGAMQGLVDIRKSANRPHGNLKPSNILLTNSADLAAATVHLADPAPDGALQKGSANKDLLDLGKVLYQLVNLRPFDGGTIPRTKDWNELGPNGEDWRKLCNSLLDSHAPAEERDLEKIIPLVQTWTAKPKQNKAPILIAASVFLVLVLGGGSLWFFTRPPKLNFDESKWQKLCLSYYSWFGDFSDQMSDENTRKKFANAPYPTDLVKLFNDAGKDLAKYPPKIIAKKPAGPVDLAVDPTDAAKTGYGPYYTSKADDLIDAVSNALTPEHWSLLGQLDKTAKQYDERGWQKPAAGIRALIESAKPPALPDKPPAIAERAKLVKPADVYLGVEKTIKAASTVTTIETRWARIQDALKKLPGAGGAGGDAQNVALLKALPKFAEDFPRSQADADKPGTLEDVTSLANAFTQIEQVINQLVTDLSKPGQEIVYSELAKDPAVQVPDPAALTPASFTALPTIAKNYVKITDDPRASADWAKSLAEIQASYIAVITEANPQDKNLPALIQSRDEVQKQIADWAVIPPIEKNRDQLKTLVNTAKTKIDTLKSNGNEWVAPYIIDPATYIAQQPARLTSSPRAKSAPSIYAAWQKAHSDLLAKAQADPASLKKYLTYKDYNGKFDALEKAYGEFDALIPAIIPELSTVTGNDWRHAIAAYVAKDYREKALSDLVSKFTFTWGPEQTLVPDQTYVSFSRQRLDEFEKARKDTVALIADYVTINDRLDHLYLIPNEPAPNARSWRDIYSQWQQSKNALLSDATITASLKPITDRIIALTALDPVLDYKPLLAATASPAPEIALTAWRKLGSAPITEDTPVLDDEDKAESNLTTQLDKLSQAKTIDNAQHQRLSAEIAAQRPVRWHRWADSLTTAAAIQVALDRRDSFKATLSPQTDAPMLYNQALYQLRKDFDADGSEAHLKQVGPEFISRVKALPAASQADVQDLLTRMDKSLNQPTTESSAAGAGPKLAGWEQDSSREGIRLFYLPSKAAPKYTLEFVRMQVANKTIFLCTTEVSAGLFMDAVNASNKFADLDNATKAKAAHWFKIGDDPWNGPRIWKIVDRKFGFNPFWLFKVPQMGENPYYPDQATPAAASADLPMQYLSPWAAIYGARLLGCRLPTSDEWLAAYEKFESSNTAAPKDVWNLRGAAWQLQQDYANKLSGSGMKYPDDGIFLPVNLLFAPITAKDAKPWKAADLAKIAPNRITNSPDIYKGSLLWFRKVGSQPGAPSPGASSGAMHDLVGNVAEYVFDGSPDKPANAVLKDAIPTVTEIDAAITAGKKNLSVIGGSSLSPPDIVFNKKQPLDPDIAQTASGFSDVGFRLAYTAPIDSIVDVLASTFKDPKYLPGPKAKP